MFLSLLDERARPKGSRDPLGFEVVWTHFGRRLVGNLTTVTSSWRTFAVGLLGFHWCNQLCRGAPPTERQRLVQEYFIRYEQLTAYLRARAGDEDILGITRVRKRLDETPGSLTIGTGQRSQLLSNQLSYGIWGLYSSALRATGLADGSCRELTARGRELAEIMERALKRDWYWPFLRGERTMLTVSSIDHKYLNFQRSVFAPHVEKTLIEALLRGAIGHDCQQALYEACRTLPPEVLRNADMDTLLEAIREQTDSPRLRQRIDETCELERLLVVANHLFAYMRVKNGVLLTELADIIRQDCRFDWLPAGPDLRGVPNAEYLTRLRDRLRANDIHNALLELLAMNATVMRHRGGAPWVEKNEDGTLNVRVKAETAYLPPVEQLQTEWHYDYFLAAYQRIAGNDWE